MLPDNELEDASSAKPAEANAYKINDDDNLEEKDLRRTFLFGKGDEEKKGDEPGLESDGAGGQRFGQNNDTPAGDDKNNPSQNAGYTNEYFRRTEPLEEHPENENFKDPNQLGQSNYAQAQASDTGQSDNGGNNNAEKEVNDDNKSDSEKHYTEGTADGDDTNIPGPNEIADQ